jgi:hypothetical protein
VDPLPLEETVAFIESAPHSSQALLLFALISTLAVDQGGHMFKLIKLREMEPATRRLAFSLMEMMAEGGNRGPQWEDALARINKALRNS